jgi:hypothetical protein
MRRDGARTIAARFRPINGHGFPQRAGRARPVRVDAL